MARTYLAKSANDLLFQLAPERKAKQHGKSLMFVQVNKTCTVVCHLIQHLSFARSESCLGRYSIEALYTQHAELILRRIRFGTWAVARIKKKWILITQVFSVQNNPIKLIFLFQVFGLQESEKRIPISAWGLLSASAIPLQLWYLSLLAIQWLVQFRRI